MAWMEAVKSSGGGGGGSGAIVEEGDFTVTSATTPVVIPVQMADYDVLVASATIVFDWQDHGDKIVAHYESLNPSNAESAQRTIVDIFRGIRWQGYLDGYSMSVTHTAKTLALSNTAPGYVGDWHYIAIKFAS